MRKIILIKKQTVQLPENFMFLPFQGGYLLSNYTLQKRAKDSQFLGINNCRAFIIDKIYKQLDFYRSYQMMRTSFLGKSILSSRYLVNHKKPLVELPIHKPPKYIYKVKYHATAVPTFDEGFRDHAHSNPFDEIAMNDMQLYRFKYSGQWWYIGNIIPKLLTIAFPFWLIWELRQEGEMRKAAGRQSLSSWKKIPEFLSQSKVIAPTL